MKVAFVHELLTMKGGAERVLRVLADMFPDAPIYTLLYDEQKLGDWFPKERMRCSPIQKRAALLHAALRIPHFAFNHHLYLSRFPSAVEAWDFSAFDLVISSSSAFGHGIITNGKPKHVSFVHSPARYLWDRTHDVLEQAGKGFLGPLKRAYLERVFHTLRIWDAESAARPDRILAASKGVQRRIELYWRRESTVVYPPIDDFWFQHPATWNLQPVRIREHIQHPHYVLVVSTLVPYKRTDLAVVACNRLGMHLKIIGEGPDRGRLEKLAGPTIEFYGYRCGDELRDLYAGAIATIVPGDEDFNLVALESMACGTPVIAFAAGGPLETILEGKTGEFFREPTPESLMDAILNLRTLSQAEGSKNEQKKYSMEECQQQAKRFSRKQFVQNIERNIATLMETR